jgi:hypothetical protein
MTSNGSIHPSFSSCRCGIGIQCPLTVVPASLAVPQALNQAAVRTSTATLPADDPILAVPVQCMHVPAPVLLLATMLTQHRWYVCPCRSNVPEADPGAPSVPFVGAGIGGTLAVRTDKHSPQHLKACQHS